VFEPDGRVFMGVGGEFAAGGDTGLDAGLAVEVMPFCVRQGPDMVNAGKYASRPSWSRQRPYISL